MRSKALILCIALIASVAVWLACASTAPVPSATVDRPPRLVVMSAFSPELQVLLGEAAIADTCVINGRRHYIGHLAGNDVVLVLSGISMVNAAMTAQTVLDHFNVSAIVFSGIAGGVNPDLSIGDVAVPAQWGQYQEHRFARETPQGWDLAGASAEFGNFGMMFPQSVSVARREGTPDELERRFWFPVSSEMLDVARTVATQVSLTNRTAAGDCLKADPKVVVGGNGVSGPTFVDNAKYRDWVWRTFRADALDMESAALAHVAYANGVPFIVFRSLSDLAGGGRGQNQLLIFFQLAADNSAAVVIAFLEAWATR